MRDVSRRRLAVGFFDGVHLGHQAILAGADFALTFENHPISFLDPGHTPRLIMSWAERAKAIEALGVRVTALEFDAEIANMPPERFLDCIRTLAGSQGWGDPRELVIRAGANWRFGKDGAGCVDWLREHGVDVEVVPYAVYQGETISSTRIRRTLESGRIAEANAMMGRSFGVGGIVFAGKGEGRRLGCPTINVRPSRTDGVRLPFGVYAVEVEGMKAIANFGHAPTFGPSAWPDPVWEIHLLTAKERVLPSELTFSLNGFLRRERTFASPEELKEQIRHDIESLKED